jgi:hypothetical protein
MLNFLKTDKEKQVAKNNAPTQYKLIPAMLNFFVTIHPFVEQKSGIISFAKTIQTNRPIK